jgi:hypothetical protein
MAALLALSCFWGSQGTAYGEGMVGPQNMEEPMATIILYKELDTDGEGMVGPQNMEKPLWLPLSYTKSLTQMGRSFFPTIGMQAK